MLSKAMLTRHPLIFSIVLVGAAIIIDTLLGALIGVAFTGVVIQVRTIIIGAITGIVLSAILLIVISRADLRQELGLRKPERWSALLWALPLLLYGLFPLLGGLQGEVGILLLALVAGLTIASWKLLLLGLLHYAWKSHGKWQSILYAAIFFTVMHLGALLVGAAVVPTLLLSISYFFLAVAFISISLRIGAYWPVIACYALYLISAFATVRTGAANLTPSTEALIFVIALTIILAIYGSIVSRRKESKSSQTLEKSLG